MDQPVIWFVMSKGDPHNFFNITNATYDRIQVVYGVYYNDYWETSPYDVLVHTSGYAPDGFNNIGYYRGFDSLIDTI
jgi:hypothetical protein